MLDDMRSLTAGFAGWALGEDALIDAVQCVILANWTPDQPIGDEDVAELFRVFHDLTGWEPTIEEKEAAQP
jgi:hypothetical protein